ncbi:hypothetical protein EBR96_09415, partial [bacterium]|nr:hypothetical protein [bacterium]
AFVGDGSGINNIPPSAFSGIVGIALGGTGATTFNSRGVIYENGGVLQSGAALTTGQFWIGNASGLPIPGSLSSGSSKIEVNLSGGSYTVSHTGSAPADVPPLIGVALNGIGFDTFGHVSSVSTFNFDTRYLRQSGGTLTGTQTFSGTDTDLTTATNEDFAIIPNGTGKVGIGTTAPSAYLDVAGSVKATTFTGSGSGLTNVPATQMSGVVPVSNGGTGLGTSPANGQILIGNGTTYTLSTLAGTTNQISVANGIGSITLSLPQSIDTGAAVRFSTVNVDTSLAVAGNKLIVDGINGRVGISTANPVSELAVSGTVTATYFAGDGNGLYNISPGAMNGILPIIRGGTGAGTLTSGGILYGNGTGAIAAFDVLTNGQLLIGDGAGAPTVGTITGTTNQVNVTNGAGSITLSLPQNIDTAANVQFGTVTGAFVGNGSGLTNLSTAQLVGVTSIANGGTGLSTTPGNGKILIGNGTTYTLANIS